MRHITPILAFKNTQRFFSRFALWSMLTCILLLLIGCKGCDNELEDNVGNGNDNPEVLFIETWGTEIRNALQVAAGYDCLGTADFEARVNIEVRTAHLEDGVPVIDPIPYYEEVLLNVDFFKNNGFNEGTIIDIEVPETGGYLLAYEVEINGYVPNEKRPPDFRFFLDVLFNLNALEKSFSDRFSFSKYTFNFSSSNFHSAST